MDQSRKQRGHEREQEHVPLVCPRGHRLGPGRVLVGWSPCVCPPCAGRGRGLRGHRTYLCLTCKDDHVTTMCYLPYHVAGAGTDHRWP